ncbi:unnamed protein product [Anisakis simplex]|uniref:Uncharacterized protein n=1 Tax=Anisakis simplex TaxID=6269 RepID=A0A0M3JAB9_ANISI|nr:unnamed protein product [Anisakis simplex]
MLQDGGIKALLNLPGSSIPTRALLIALIIRHCIDDETALSQIFEKTIRTVAAGGYNLRTSSSRWHHRMPRSTRDWMHAMRALAPLCARHPQLFYTTVKRVARKQNSQITAVPAAPSSETVTPKLSHSASARKVSEFRIIVIIVVTSIAIWSQSVDALNAVFGSELSCSFSKQC